MVIGIIDMNTPTCWRAFLVTVLLCTAPAGHVAEQPPATLPNLKAPAVAGSLPAMQQYPAGPPRKQAFWGFLTPIVQAENKRQRAIRAAALPLAAASTALTGAQAQWLNTLCQLYRITTPCKPSAALTGAIRNRVDSIPASLALAQAANESAWGTSRFARLGNNLFGQWCHTKGCGIVPSRRDSGAVHEVRRFANAASSVRAYMNNLNSHRTYAKLRGLRADMRERNRTPTGLVLARGLERYSARGEDYVKELQSMIRYNKLQPLDSE